MQIGYIGIIAPNYRQFSRFITKFYPDENKNKFVYIADPEYLRGRDFSKIIRLNSAPLPYKVSRDELEYIVRRNNLQIEEIKF